MVYMMLCMLSVTMHKIEHPHYNKREKKRRRLNNLNRLITESDIICKSELRIDRKTFTVLCEMVRDIGGLSGSSNMSLQEIVAMFLYTLAHHFKNRTISSYFIRSGETISRHFHHCLLAILKLHNHLLKKPTLIPEDCEDDRWKCFKVLFILKIFSMKSNHYTLHVKLNFLLWDIRIV